MAYPLDGCLIEPQLNLRNLLRDCPAFQAWVGLPGDPSNTEARIHLTGLPDPVDGEFREYAPVEMSDARPMAIINPVRENGFRKSFTAFGEGGFQFHDSGRLELYLEQLTPLMREAGGGYELATADTAFQTYIGRIIQGMADLAGRDGYLAIDEIALVAGPFRTAEEDRATQADAQFAVLEISWGTVSGH